MESVKPQKPHLLVNNMLECQIQCTFLWLLWSKSLQQEEQQRWKTLAVRIAVLLQCCCLAAGCMHGSIMPIARLSLHTGNAPNTAAANLGSLDAMINKRQQGIPSL